MQFDQIILVVALCAVASILVWGVFTMASGGAYNLKKFQSYHALPDHFSRIGINNYSWFDVASWHRAIKLCEKSVGLQIEKQARG